jgi:hypothetical protein
MVRVRIWRKDMSRHEWMTASDSGVTSTSVDVSNFVPPSSNHRSGKTTTKASEWSAPKVTNA